METLRWISLFFWIIGAVAIVNGLNNHDVWVLCLGTLLWVGSNFFEIIFNRHIIRNINQERK